MASSSRQSARRPHLLRISLVAALAAVALVAATTPAGAAGQGRKAGGGPFRAWEKHPAVALEVAVAGVANGWVEMFHIGTNNVIYRKAPSAGINSWQALPGTYATKIAATMGADGRVWLVHAGRDGGIYVNSQVAPGGRFGASWQRYPGRAKEVAIAKGPGVAGRSNIELFHIGTDNHLYRWGFQDIFPQWNRMTPLPFGYAKRVSAAKMLGQGVALAYIGRDNAIYVATQGSAGGAFGAWRKYSASAKDVAISGVGRGGFELFDIGPDNAVYRQAPAQGVTGWQRFAGTYAKRIAANANREGRVELAHIGSDNSIYLSWQIR